MSYIQFESAREKDKARAELRAAREALLEDAKKRAVQRAEREASKQLKGEVNWMHPAVEKKLKKKEKELKKLKKKKDKKKSAKTKKKTKKKHKHQSSSEEESEESSDEDTSSTESSTSESSSSSEEDKRHKKSKKSSKKSKRKKKEAKHKKQEESSSSESSEEDGEERWSEAPKPEVPVQRDSWMTDALMLKTYSRERPNKPQEKQQIDTYDPAKSTRELNPYWKITGTGLPGFQKPRDDDEYESRHTARSSTSQSSSRGWRKQSDANEIPKERKPPPPTRKRSATPSSSSNSSSSEHDDRDNVKEKKQSASTSDFLTDQQMNELAAKILKAEIMGDLTAVEEMRAKLEKARVQRNLFKERKKAEVEANRHQNKEKSKKTEEEHVLLTHTDQSGHSRPLPASKFVDPRDLYGGKKKQKRVKTHDDEGQRVRYFADDDRYDIKQMFEREKYTTASQANLEFADLAAKNKNPNDDLEDIFAEKICKDDSSREARRERDRAIREHQKMEAVLDNCYRCFDSTKMQKELLVAVGDKVYLALPWYQGLQTGHCMIIPTQHATCCTQLDEDTWEEINDFRKALTRMFAAQRKDVIFFEIANRLHKRPHLAIHCIPIRESEGEMAPFYFKKAIEESEHEWCVNKQLVSLSKKSLRSSIPKGLPYFWVNFGMDTGFAHVIEDEQRFPQNFAEEIIGGMLHLDANKWRRQQKEQNIITKVKMFADWWKKYDCTK
ncbi:CWF19-like protein 2 homolog [Musca domestica]|uniref:CWF19-like protein 2 homolog n=1 Tax=Musca domestica TaxID=7370 RepID=A0A1I8MP01_MUSDO|nr:CWF19-like protein 2 homolog [Musca domestica]